MHSIEAIYKEHSKMVYRYLLSLTGDSDLAEELTQETFFQAVKGIHRFDRSCKVSTWLCAIAKNQLKSWRRKNPVMEDISESHITWILGVLITRSARLLRGSHIFESAC